MALVLSFFPTLKQLWGIWSGSCEEFSFWAAIQQQGGMWQVLIMKHLQVFPLLLVSRSPWHTAACFPLYAGFHLLLRSLQLQLRNPLIWQHTSTPRAPSVLIHSHVCPYYWQAHCGLSEKVKHHQVKPKRISTMCEWYFPLTILTGSGESAGWKLM